MDIRKSFRIFVQKHLSLFIVRYLKRALEKNLNRILLSVKNIQRRVFRSTGFEHYQWSIRFYILHVLFSISVFQNISVFEKIF